MLALQFLRMSCRMPYRGEGNQPPDRTQSAQESASITDSYFAKFATLFATQPDFNKKHVTSTRHHVFNLVVIEPGERRMSSMPRTGRREICCSQGCGRTD